MPNEQSIELCYEDIHRIAEEKIGFQFLVRNKHIVIIVVIIVYVGGADGFEVIVYMWSTLNDANDLQLCV